MLEFFNYYFGTFFGRGIMIMVVGTAIGGALVVVAVFLLTSYVSRRSGDQGDGDRW